VQPSKIRIFPDEEYKKIGAIIQKDLSECPVVFGVKEMPSSFFLPGKPMLFFSTCEQGTALQYADAAVLDGFEMQSDRL